MSQSQPKLSPSTDQSVADAQPWLLSQRVLDTVRQPFLVLDAALAVHSANNAFYDAFQVTPAQTLGRAVSDLGNGQWGRADLGRLLRQVLPTHTPFEGFEVVHDFPTLGHRVMVLYGREVAPVGPSKVEDTPIIVEEAPLILVAIEDVTERQAEQERREADAARERRVADGLRRALQQTVPEDAFPGLSVATASEGSLGDSVGGDFFDALALPGGGIALIVGDVEGHGLEAAMRIGEVKYALRAFLREDPVPAFALSRLNELVCAGHRLDAQAERLHTVVSLVVISPRTWTATFTRAGAEPPIVLRADGTWEEVAAGGLMLGAREEIVYRTETRPLERGDTLLMLTDGLSEARGERGGPFFGAARVARRAYEMMRANGPLTDEPLHVVAEAILESAHAHARGPFADDACLLLACRR